MYSSHQNDSMPGVGGLGGSAGGGSSAATVVNKTIQQVAQRYCNECRTTFDELSKFIQKVLASRKELVEYDHRQQEKTAAMRSGAGAQSTGMTPVATPLTSPHPSPSPSSVAMAIPSCQLAERQ